MGTDEDVKRFDGLRERMASQVTDGGVGGLTWAVSIGDHVVSGAAGWLDPIEQTRPMTAAASVSDHVRTKLVSQPGSGISSSSINDKRYEEIGAALKPFDRVKKYGIGLVTFHPTEGYSSTGATFKIFNASRPSVADSTFMLCISSALVSENIFLTSSSAMRTVLF